MWGHSINIQEITQFSQEIFKNVKNQLFSIQFKSTFEFKRTGGRQGGDFEPIAAVAREFVRMI